MALRVVFLNNTAYLLLALIGVVACKQGKSSIVTRIAIPPVYLLCNDNGFYKNQDTLYYKTDKYCGYAYQLSPTADTLFVCGYYNGLEQGALKKWYCNGQMQELRYYYLGKKNGKHTAWWSNGNKKFEFNIIDDFYEGNFKEWNANGTLIKDGNYRHGQEQGSQKLWWDDGTLRANYVVENGKKYGLIGLKICRNPYDSVIKN